MAIKWRLKLQLKFVQPAIEKPWDQEAYMIYPHEHCKLGGLKLTAIFSRAESCSPSLVQRHEEFLLVESGYWIV